MLPVPSLLSVVWCAFCLWLRVLHMVVECSSRTASVRLYRLAAARTSAPKPPSPHSLGCWIAPLRPPPTDSGIVGRPACKVDRTPSPSRTSLERPLHPSGRRPTSYSLQQATPPRTSTRTTCAQPANSTQIERQAPARVRHYANPECSRWRVNCASGGRLTCLSSCVNELVEGEERLSYSCSSVCSTSLMGGLSSVQHTTRQQSWHSNETKAACESATIRRVGVLPGVAHLSPPSFQLVADPCWQRT